MDRKHFAIVLCCFAASLLRADSVLGHGTPIHVHVDSGLNQMIVSLGVPSDGGFAPYLFAEDDEDGDPQMVPNLPGFGPVSLWTIPGFELYGFSSSSSLSLEVLSRPIVDEVADQRRLLWRWDPVLDRVIPAADSTQLHLLAQQNRSLTIAGDDTLAPPTLLLANSLGGQTGFHNHGLLAFALDNDPMPPSGVYGFFARLQSSQYAASDPFLVALNFNVDYAEVLEAAAEINAAASLAGDYDRNDVVDGADYLIWKQGYSSNQVRYAYGDGNGNGIVDAADYTVWRNNFGTSLGSGALVASNFNVPEPASMFIVAAALTIIALHRRRA
jgi:hypothetical protein